jgi:hypothetical protein
MHLRTTAKALTVAGITGALALTAGGIANAATSTFTAKATQTSFKVIKDVAPKGPSKGDVYQFTERLTQGGKQIGSDKVTLTIISASKATADGIFTFKTGTLHVHGTVPPQPTPGKTLHVPIVGGAGAYKGAHGTLDVTPNKGNTSTEVFHITT